MYNVLLVDDEPGALKSMKYLLNWEQYGFTIAGEASNGRQALDMFKSGSYSLVITDIRMPTMDGLELIAGIRAISNVQIIIMSGYEDYSYAKKALSYRVKDYLLKPAEADDVERLLKAVESELEYSYKVEQKLYYGLQALRDQVVKKWVHGFIQGEEVMGRLGMLDIVFREEYGICFMLVELDMDEWADSGWMDTDLQLKRFAVRNVMEEVVGLDGCVFEESEMRFGIVLFSEAEMIERAFVIAVANNVSTYVERFTKVGVTVGVGKLVYTAKAALESVLEAGNMLEQQFFFGTRTVLAREQLISRTDSNRDLYWRDITDILSHIKEGDPEAIRSLLVEKWNVFSDNLLSSVNVKAMVVELFVEMFRLVKDRGVDYDALFAPRQFDYERIVRTKTLAGLFDITLEKSEKVACLLSKRPISHAGSVIETVKGWIDDKYGEAVSMKSIASQVYMNAAYLGQLFKEETGISFNDYLLQVRMEKAKEMLISTERKVYEVASAVGYNDMDWFYKKFKRYTGLSPSEYRFEKHNN